MRQSRSLSSYWHSTASFGFLSMNRVVSKFMIISHSKQALILPPRPVDPGPRAASITISLVSFMTIVLPPMRGHSIVDGYSDSRAIPTESYKTETVRRNVSTLCTSISSFVPRYLLSVMIEPRSSELDLPINDVTAKMTHQTSKSPCTVAKYSPA